MKGNYPRFAESYSREELIEHFMLNETEQDFTVQFKGDANQHGVAILLKSLQYLGYFPSSLNEAPTQVKLFIANQLNLDNDPSTQYPWETRTRDNHLAIIRQHTGFRFPTAEDKKTLEIWLRQEGARDSYTFPDLFDSAVGRLGLLHIELPTEKELTRVVNAALSGFFYDVHHQIKSGLSVESCEEIDKLLIIPAGDAISTFERVKASAGPVGLKSLHKEIVKLQRLRSVGITSEVFTGIPFKVIKILERRAKNETAWEMRRHPDEIRYGLMACFIHISMMEIIDRIVDIFVAIIHRIDVRAEGQRDQELLKDIKHVEGKNQILFRLSEVIMSNPDGRICDVIFPVVKEETFRRLIAEKRASGPQYHFLHQHFMRQKYTHHYSRMLPLVLENITFRSDNRFQPIIEALSIIKQYLGTKYKYFPVSVPIEGVVTGVWAETVVEKVGTEVKVNRKYYELCVLQQLERALRCKEIWVEGSYEWRNPGEDLPTDWVDESKRAGYYQRLSQPIAASSFVENIRQEMIDALADFNRRLPDNPEVSIYKVCGSE